MARMRAVRNGVRQTPRLEDVARIAGVSTITVSRVINAPDKVSVVTRERVKSAIEETGYMPDLVAGSLASRRTRIVGVVLPTVNNSLFADTIQGMTERLRAAGYQLMIGSTSYHQNEEEDLVRAFLGRRADAIVLTGTSHSAKIREMLARAAVPVVEMWNLAEEPLDMVVGFSNYEAARQMVLHLAGRGYRRIGFIGGPIDGNDRISQRERGYIAALREAALPVRSECMTRSEIDFAAGADAFGQLMERTPELDAVFASSDVLAVGAMLECLRRGWPVPERIALAGIDDSVIGGQMVPPLTTVRIPRYAIGTEVARILLERLNGRSQERRVVDLGFEIVQRGSS